MWLMTKHGFYSVVLAKLDPKQPSRGSDPDTVMVRARMRKHLEALAEVNPAMAEFDIVESEQTDYRYRIICPREVWATTHARLLDDLDYPNFKSACERRYGYNDPYCQKLHDVWSVMYGIQSASAHR